MFRITEDPSSGSLVQCLAKNYRNDSIVSVDMDKAGVIAAYTVNYTHAQRVRMCCHNTYLVQCQRTRQNHSCNFQPSTVQGSLMMVPLLSETCWSTFKYFIILILSTYILCISWIIKCLIIIDARCKHEDFPPYLTFNIFVLAVNTSVMFYEDSNKNNYRQLTFGKSNMSRMKT